MRPTSLKAPAEPSTEANPTGANAHEVSAPEANVHPEKATIKGRLDYIDVLRATAALAVFAVHTFAYWLGTPIHQAHGVSLKAFFYRVASLGASGVDLFIVISGFCLAYPLYRGTQRSHGPRRLRPVVFYKRRAFRILPAYYFVLVVLFLLELVPPVQRLLVAHRVTGWDLLAHVFLVQSWFPATLGAINGPFWSIALEVQLYLGFPLLLLLVRKFGLVRMMLVLSAVAIVWAIFSSFWYDQGLSHTIGGSLNKELPARWLEFGLGVCAARIVTAPRRGDGWIVAAALGLGFPLALASESANFEPGRWFGWGTAAFGTLLLFSKLPHRIWAGNRVGRTFRRLGVISFSFYLVHQPVLLLLGPTVRSLGLPGPALLALGMTGGVLLTACLAAVFFHFVEKPFLIHGGMRDAVVMEMEGAPV